MDRPSRRNPGEPMMDDERTEQLLALRRILDMGQADIAAGRFRDAFEFLDSLEREDLSGSDGHSTE